MIFAALRSPPSDHIAVWVEAPTWYDAREILRVLWQTEAPRLAAYDGTLRRPHIRIRWAGTDAGQRPVRRREYQVLGKRSYGKWRTI